VHHVGPGFDFADSEMLRDTPKPGESTSHAAEHASHGRDAPIRPLAAAGEATACARLMAASEPWRTLGRTSEQVLPMLHDPLREVYVYDEGGRVAGCIVLCLTGPFAGYIQAVCVAADVRGRGIGTALVRFAERRIGDVSPAVFLLVSSFNTGARALYERLGYAVAGELNDYVVDGHSEILMWKRSMSLSRFAELSGGTDAVSNGG
jgi:[ribosomal protein S18]-alanine N-acetyltransferase